MANEPSNPSAFPQRAVACLERGNTVDAMLIVSKERGLGLKESKDMVDAYLKSRPDLQRRVAEAKQRFVPWLVVLLVLVAVLAYFVIMGK